MKKCTINLYTFDELSEKAKEKAIAEHREFLLSMMSPNDFISGDIEHDTAAILQATYEIEYEYYCLCDEPIIESLQINEYEFFQNGELATNSKILEV